MRQQRSKGQIFFSTMGSILKALWRMFLLGVYALAKITETVAIFVAKLTDKMLN